jgi:hypothetical protein
MELNALTEKTAFQRIIAHHVARYPRLQIQDLYKLVYQAAMGSEHAVRDIGAVERWLEQELMDLGEGPAEPVEEEISPDGRIVRVNLRPYIATGGDVRALLAAFVRTGQEMRGSWKSIERYWEYVQGMVGELPFEETELRNYIGRMKERGYPAVHHSEAYGRAYRPAYRVIGREYLECT